MADLKVIRDTEWGPIRHADQDRLLSYWQEACEGGAIPLRERFDPVDVPRLLPRVALIEAFDDGEGLDFRYRLAGTEIVRRAGRDPTGKAFGVLYKGDYLETARQTYRDLMESGRPILSERVFQPDSGGISLRYDRLILPYSSDGTQVDRFVLLVNVTDHDGETWVEGSFRMYGRADNPNSDGP